MTWLTACETEQPSTPDAAPRPIDASKPDATPALPCPASEAKTFYADYDGDGFGTPDLIAVDCEQPASFVDNNLDCDDTDSRLNPESTELCDGIDNDCDAATTEVCGNACSPQTRESDTYLYCAQVLTFSVAKAACVAEGMHLIRIDDASEQAWMSAQRSIAFGGLARIWMGGNDATSEGVWVWHDDEQFWQGQAGGTVVGGLYTHWRGGEPNNSDGEDCGTIDNVAAGRWDDRACSESHRFVCERDSEIIE